MPVTYYHVTHPLIGAGSVIENGNFGRLLEKYMPGFGDISTLYREEILELIRKEQYPEKPSRFNSIFLLDTLENAVIYRNFNAKNQNIYKVKVIDPEKPTHKGFWCPPFPIGNYRQYCFEYAKIYWKGEIKRINIMNDNINTPVIPVEVIVESAVRVVARIVE
ncbi:DUF2441 domain-containing protein [Desulfovibrio fairfieldensis]|uniref:DUF2441 domain-containing protein n=1 Tax=Desulfovibrio fairfieldensis TaxID=44742 RepID=UPI000ABD8B94|nr:DUF2441 domain-containing protein [Desulfovibrio fairfieldensis]